MFEHEINAIYFANLPFNILLICIQNYSGIGDHARDHINLVHALSLSHLLHTHTHTHTHTLLMKYRPTNPAMK